ncbi:hypothetical protein BDV25DRAFT_160882 [Aspergillus avenaceus]|uniref:Glycosyltransferase family 31 protein n=1 Tax=Aspergillus avenaceus TaxID=36643 RepID=A0A5N6TLP4_ASPAV|nr:hypothetical protein BDV25DRAFT_160882 [Aspergillus avenaceus]
MQLLCYGPLSQWRQSMALRAIAAAATCLLIFAVFSLYGRHDNAQLGPVVNAESPFLSLTNSSACHVDLDLLRTHASNISAEYARLEIVVARTSNFTQFSETLDLPKLNFHPVQLYTADQIELLPKERCFTSATIQAPVASAPPNASHMIFGVATSTERLYDSLDAFAHWAAGTGAHVVAVVDEDGSVEKHKKRAKELDIRLTIVQNSDELLDRYFSLVRILYEKRDELTQWVVLIDDDTFFPSMRNLVTRMKSYDPREPQYVGALTEDMSQLHYAGHMAFGGAGIFLSVPLVKQLDAVFNNCYDFKHAGDRMIARCIYHNTLTKLTWERGLHQMDLRGDASGFYESGRSLPLSIHHWKSWFHADMVGLSKVASICGEDCLLRRWRFSKQDNWYLVNGFSVVEYSAPFPNPDAMEQTWDDSKYQGLDPFDYSLGPLRKKDEGKISFRLREAISERERKQIRQIYVQQRKGDQKPRVIEVVWKSLSNSEV